MTSQSPSKSEPEAPAPAKAEVEETAFTKDVWVAAAGRGEWRAVKPPLMAAALFKVKPTKKLTRTEVLAELKRVEKEG